jgi:uncharacterized membrane protein YjjP (DUF1212 family)
MMHLKKQAEMILAFAKALYVNGQTSQIVIVETIKLANLLNLKAELMIRWGEIILEVQDKNTGAETNLMILADPSQVHMGRVMSIMNLLKKIHNKQISIEKAYDTLTTLAHLAPAHTWQFVMASGVGAVALGVIFGLNHWMGALLIFISACLGGFCRRYLAKLSSNLFIQPFCAAFIAGIVGAMTIQESSTLRLIAVCPCMILVPGAHFLNGILDFMRARIHLGLCRFMYANLICIAIISGLLIGLNLFGGSLPVATESIKFAPLAWDVIAAGFAVMAYCIFFSMPWKMMIWPTIIGMFAHTLRWMTVIYLDMGLITATLIACLFVGVSLTWISYQKNLPFAAGGFSAVVSMIPGVFLFRMASGLIQLTEKDQATFALFSDTLYQGIMATLILFAIGIGLLVPRLLLDAYFLKNFKYEEIKFK